VQGKCVVAQMEAAKRNEHIQNQTSNDALILGATGRSRWG
jgi:hypothetical protein